MGHNEKNRQKTGVYAPHTQNTSEENLLKLHDCLRKAQTDQMKKNSSAKEIKSAARKDRLYNSTKSYSMCNLQHTQGGGLEVFKSATMFPGHLKKVTWK